MVTLIPIEPRNEAHGALIVEAFSRFFINRGGQSDGWGDGNGGGFGGPGGFGDGNGDGWDNGGGGGNGWGYGDGGNDYDSPPEEWLVGP
jgi:hypothetical protein